MSKNVACTIVSKNYMHYAKTLRNSFLKHNSDDDFYILLVDEIGDDKELLEDGLNIVEASKIGIKDFNKLAFKYNIVEFNTSVKASFLKYLQNKLGYKNVMYIDPDIKVFSSLKFIFDLLDDHSLVLTPHMTQPMMDKLKPGENDILRGGTFNLGFIAVGSSKESKEFMDWWESKLLENCYNEPRNGLFTDQKWIDLVPSLFDNYYVLKDVGCNVAYWNFHQRMISNKDGNYFVNENIPLKFFHFSGLNVKSDKEISKYQNRYDLSTRSDLKELFTNYREELKKNGFYDVQKYSYTYAHFTNGLPISNLARKLYAVNMDKFSSNPFDHNGDFYKWSKKNHLLSRGDKVKTYTTMNYNKDDSRLKVIHFILRSVLRVAGVNKYESLMKYFGYVAVLRNQKEIFS